MYAHIRDGVVAEILQPVEGFTFEDCFHPDIIAACVPCGPEVQQHWIWDGDTFSPPLAPTIDLAAYAANCRWRLEQSGARWNGWPIHTDAVSQGKYLAELQAITLGERIDGDGWKFADGVFRPVSNADFPALAIAARAHVRAAFVIEGTVLVGIADGTITTTDEINNWLWPDSQ